MRNNAYGGEMKKGFTLAECLITLGIIGVVTALLLQNLFSEFRKNRAEVRLQKTISTLDNAIRKSEQEKDIVWLEFHYMSQTYEEETGNSSLDFSNCGKWVFERFIAENVIYQSINSLDREATLLKPGVAGFASIRYGFPFRLNNGVLCFIYNGEIFIVVNEKRGIEAGKDVFKYSPAINNVNNPKQNRYSSFTQANIKKYSRDVIHTACRDGSGLSSGTQNDQKLSACSHLFYDNGMKFPKDYPIKF